MSEADEIGMIRVLRRDMKIFCSCHFRPMAARGCVCCELKHSFRYGTTRQGS